MSVQELSRRQRQRAASQAQPSAKDDDEIHRRARQRAASLANPEQSNPIRAFERVMPFPQWCKLKGFSLATGKRLVKAGKVRLVHLSANRKGVSESEDARYMRACESAS
jgi:hypothetical protein